MSETQAPTEQEQALDAIYRHLVRGRGHELVNEQNVWALLKRAEQNGHTVLAEELREWQASC